MWDYPPVWWIEGFLLLGAFFTLLGGFAFIGGLENLWREHNVASKLRTMFKARALSDD